MGVGWLFKIYQEKYVLLMSTPVIHSRYFFFSKKVI